MNKENVMFMMLMISLAMAYCFVGYESRKIQKEIVEKQLMDTVKVEMVDIVAKP